MYLDSLLHQLVPLTLHTSLGPHISLDQLIHIHPFKQFGETEISEYIRPIGELQLEPALFEQSQQTKLLQDLLRIASHYFLKLCIALRIFIFQTYSEYILWLHLDLMHLSCYSSCKMARNQHQNFVLQLRIAFEKGSLVSHFF